MRLTHPDANAVGASLRTSAVRTVAVWILALLASACGGVATGAGNGTGSAPGGNTATGTNTQTQTSTQPQTQSTTAATTSGGVAGASSAGGFHGLLQFDGTRHPRPTDPNLRGALVIQSWAQVEPSPGVYSFDSIDQAAALWAAQGKKIAIRIQSLTKQGDGYPSWLAGQGVTFVTDHSGLRDPVFWDPAYLAQVKSMINALAARYDGDVRVLWVQAAIGVWGETKVQDDMNSTHLSSSYTQPWYSAGYTDAGWMSTIETIVGDYQAAFHKTALVTALAHGFFEGTKGYTQSTITGWLADHGVGTQDDGLRDSTTDNDPNIHRSMHIEEEYQQTAKDGQNLATDLQIALDLKSQYILVYQEDLANPAYQQTLAGVAAQAT